MRAFVMLFAFLFSLNVAALVAPSYLPSDKEGNVGYGASYNDPVDLIMYVEYRLSDNVPGTFKLSSNHGKVSVGYGNDYEVFGSWHFGHASSADVDVKEFYRLTLNSNVYVGKSVKTDKFYIDFWAGSDIFRAMKGSFKPFVGSRIYYRPVYPMYLQFETSSSSIISVNLGTHF